MDADGSQAKSEPHVRHTIEVVSNLMYLAGETREARLARLYLEQASGALVTLLRSLQRGVASGGGPKILDSEKVRGGVAVTFADGRCALYSARLLHEVFLDAEQIKVDEKEPWMRPG